MDLYVARANAPQLCSAVQDPSAARSGTLNNLALLITEGTVLTGASSTNPVNFRRFGNLMEVSGQSTPRTENHGVGGSIPPLGTLIFKGLRDIQRGGQICQ